MIGQLINNTFVGIYNEEIALDKSRSAYLFMKCPRNAYIEMKQNFEQAIKKRAFDFMLENNWREGSFIILTRNFIDEPDVIITLKIRECCNLEDMQVET